MPKKTLKIMHLGLLSALDLINNILCFYKKGYDIPVVNTHPYRFYKEVPDLAEFGIHLGVSIYMNSLPNRFLFALTAGIPIVVPQGLFPGCEEVINEYGIGFSYDDYSELRNKLCDSRYLKSCREMALSSKEKFINEYSFNVLESFFGIW